MRKKALHMGSTLSLSEVMSMASEFATIVGFVSLLMIKLFSNHLSQPCPLLNSSRGSSSTASIFE